MLSNSAAASVEQLGAEEVGDLVLRRARQVPSVGRPHLRQQKADHLWVASSSAREQREDCAPAPACR